MSIKHCRFKPVAAASLIAACVPGTSSVPAGKSWDAHTIQLVVTEVYSPTFEGRSFGSVGQYEHLRGFVVGELDPTESRNAVIVNLDRAPRNTRGNVEYRVDLEILKPVDLAHANGRMFYDVVNRGNKRLLLRVNGGSDPESNNPRLVEHAGTGFLMNEGYTIVWSGWQGDLRPGGRRMVANLPVATEPDGSPIIETHRDEFIFGNLTNPIIAGLSYPAATLDPSAASLTVRQQERDPRRPLDTWEYIDDRQIRITRPAGFDAGAIYEFIYPARDPIVMGIGFAAIRDVVSFLRYDSSTINPLAGAIEKTMAFGHSQSGRLLRDFVYWGFNQDRSGARIVFDGMIVHVAGSRRTNANQSFSVPGRYSLQHEGHLSPGDQFPFTYGIQSDALTGRTDGILRRCETAGACPRMLHVDSDTEIFQARSSLVVTQTTGAPPTLPDNVRVYLLTGSQHFNVRETSIGSRHFTSGPLLVPEQGKYSANPLNHDVHMRALVKALDEWITEAVPPPDSRFPSVADGTLVPPDDPRAQFPSIPGFTYAGVVNELRRLDYAQEPPGEGGSYPVLVGAKDADGNNLAGIRHPFLEVPVGTHTGWNLRRAGFAEGALLGLTGSYLPFAQTRRDRLLSGDSRLSLEERYSDHEEYVRLVERAAHRLVRDRLLLEDDARLLVQEAEQSGIGKPRPLNGDPSPPPYR